MAKKLFATHSITSVEVTVWKCSNATDALFFVLASPRPATGGWGKPDNCPPPQKNDILKVPVTFQLLGSLQQVTIILPTLPRRFQPFTALIQRIVD